MTYEIFDPGVSQPLHLVSREKALQAFQHCQATRDLRLAQLQKYWNLTLDASPGDLDRGFTAFYQEVQNRLGTLKEPDGYLFSLAYDLSLYLNLACITRCPGLRWDLDLRNKKDLSYQRPVLTGFPGISKVFTVDFDYHLGAGLWSAFETRTPDQSTREFFEYVLGLLSSPPPHGHGT